MTHSPALTRMHHALAARTFVKVIAGIANFDHDHVLAVVDAAERAGAHAVDIAADPELIRAAKARTQAAVFVSATEPAQLIMAAEHGADVLELGNFDALYAQGIEPTAAQILDWTREVKAAVGDRLPLCVTVSGRLSLDEQVDLATRLQAAGADLIQSEGVLAQGAVTDVRSAIESITDALANAAELVRVLEVPLFVAGGITPTNAAFAIAAGAAGVGVGRAVSRAQDQDAMTDVATQVVEAVVRVQSRGRGLSRIA